MAAARGAHPAAGVSRSPMLGIAARGDASDARPDADLAGGAGDCVAGLSVARADAGRDVGAGRSLPSGGGLDPVTTGYPLLQAASSTLERSPPNGKRCSQILPGLPSAGTVANQLSESQASEEQIWRNGARLPRTRADSIASAALAVFAVAGKGAAIIARRGGIPAKHWCRQNRTNWTARH